LLDKADTGHVQYATHHLDEKVEDWSPGVDVGTHDTTHDKKGWVPIPLRAWFWIPLVTFMILLAIGLEVALNFSNKNQGWATSAVAFATTTNVMHFVYTLPPVIVAMCIVAMWAWTDLEIKKMQPYIDLVHGDSPPQKSLLLDYTRTNNFVVWISAFWNRHYLVALATLIALLALVFQPLAAAMFIVKDTWWGPPAVNVTNLFAISLNEGPTYSDLTAFLSAAGYASSSVLYNLGNPPFIYDVYTVAPFKLEFPFSLGSNPTVTANTTAIKTDPNCHLMTTASTENVGGGWTNNATFNNCTFSYSVNKTTAHLFGTDVMPDCDGTGTPEYFRPVVLWFFTYDTTPPQGSATFCTPNISLWDVTATVDITTGNLISVEEIGPFNSNSPFSSISGNVTGPPMNGQAFNGIRFNLSITDQFVIARSNATDLELPGSIFQAASTGSGGLTAAFETNSFVGMATMVYGVYLKLIAKTVYFLPVNEPILVEVNSFEKRLWMTDIAVHIEAVALLVVALVGAFVQIVHYYSRRDLRLRHEPGTIASAVSIGAETNLAQLLNGQQGEHDFIRALRDKKFRIDPRTMKIVMQGERGYEQAVSPNPRQSIFGSKRFSRTPLSSS
jgi:hypothetical protein